MVQLLFTLLLVHDFGQILSRPTTAIDVTGKNQLQLTIRNVNQNTRSMPNTYLLRYLISSVRLENCNISAEYLDSFSSLPHFRSLTIKLPKNRSLDLSVLRLMPSVKYLSCNLNTECTVLGVSRISQLESFAIAGQANDLTFDDLAKHEVPKRLRKVLISCKGDTQRIGEFVKKLTDVSELWLFGDSITDETIAAITAIKSLELLDISDAGVTGETIPAFTKARTLRISDCKITNNGIARISQMDSLEQLDLKSSGSFNVDKLSSLKLLKRLVISDSKVKSITALFAIPSLEMINARGCPLNEESLRPPEKIVLIR